MAPYDNELNDEIERKVQAEFEEYCQDMQNESDAQYHYMEELAHARHMDDMWNPNPEE